MSEYEQIHLENHMKISTIFVFETGTAQNYVMETLADKKFTMDGFIVFVEDADISRGLN